MRKIEKLQAMLADVENLKINFSNFDPLSLPLDPEVKSKQLLECIVLNDIISMYEESWISIMTSIMDNLTLNKTTLLIFISNKARYLLHEQNKLLYFSLALPFVKSLLLYFQLCLIWLSLFSPTTLCFIIFL